jgi:hypothetical protein
MGGTVMFAVFNAAAGCLGVYRAHRASIRRKF